MSNEAENVVAEVIEEQDASSLTVAYKPSVIEANFDALEAHVRKTVEAYDGATYDLTKKENIAEAKHDRSYLNGIKKEIDERRKAVKREYNKPLDAFERRCKQITAIIDEAADNIKAQLDQAEEERKARAYAKLQEHYEEFAGLLAPVVPYERFHEPQWLNKTFGEIKAQQALEAAAEEGRGHIDRADNLERGGQEERAGGLNGDHGHQLFLIFAVQRTAAVLRRERGNGRGAVVKAADGVQQLCAGAGVAHSRAAGALVDGGGLDARLIEQVGFEQVGLLERHAVLVHPDTQPAAALVLNECFHDELPPFNQGKMEKEGHFVPLFDCFGADYASAGAASAAISSAISSAQSSISAAAASASAARCSLMSFAACRMSSAFSRTVSTVFITQSFMRRTAAAAWV